MVDVTALAAGAASPAKHAAGQYGCRQALLYHRTPEMNGIDTTDEHSLFSTSLEEIDEYGVYSSCLAYWSRRAEIKDNKQEFIIISCH